MEAIQLNPKELLNRILNSSSEDILKQMEMFEANYPLLISFAKGLRNSNSSLTKMDRLVHSAEVLSAFAYLCEHNYWLFLIVTGNFAKMQELFTKYFGKKEGNLVDHIGKEYNKAVLEQNPIVFPLKVSPKNEELPMQSIMDWMPYAANTTSMDMYRCYDLMLKQANYEYNFSQSAIYYQAAIARIQRLDRFVPLLEKNNTLSSEEKNEFYLKVRVYQDRIEACMVALDAANMRLEGAAPNDLTASEEQLRAAKNYFEATSGFSELFEEYSHLGQEIEVLCIEDEEATEQVNIQLEEARAKYEERIAEWMPYLESVRQAAQKDVQNTLTTLIDIAKNCPQTALGSDQQNEPGETIAKLEDFLGKLGAKNNYVLMQGILLECSRELDKIEVIIRHAWPEGSGLLQDFEKGVVLLNRMVTETPMAPDQNQRAIFYFQEHEDLSSEPLTEEIPQSVLNRQHDSGEHRSSPCDFSGREEQPYSQHVDTTSTPNPTNTFRNEIQGLRLLEMSKDEQTRLMDVLEKIPSKVHQTKNSDLFNPEDELKLEKILSLKSAIESRELERLSQNDIQTLYETINQIDASDEHLLDIKRDLSSLFPFLKPFHGNDMRPG